MANKNQRRATVPPADGASAATEPETMKDDLDRDRDDDDREESAEARRERYVPTEAKRGFFEIYKPTQGYYTRVGTAVAAGLFILWAASFIHGKMVLIASSGPSAQYLQVGVTVAFLLVAGLIGYRVMAHNRRVNDFLIATEGEMKKVNWTSRREIAGSTRVVIIVVLALGVFLFVVDLLLMLFFSEIRVLRIMPDTFSRLLGGRGE